MVSGLPVDARQAALMYQASETCIAEIKILEGYREKAYQDAAGVWTVGYGWTIGVGPDTRMTELAADHLLRVRCMQICRTRRGPISA